MATYTQWCTPADTLFVVLKSPWQPLCFFLKCVCCMELKLYRYLFYYFFKENGLLLCYISGDVLVLCLFNEVGTWLKQLYSVYHLVPQLRKSGKFLLVESTIRNPQHGIQNPRLSVSIHSFTWGDIWPSSSVIMNNSL